MTKGLKITLTAFALTAGLIKGAPALAEQRTAEVNVSYVHTADIDLTTSVGQRELDIRLARAARDVCGTASDVDLEGKNEVRQCRGEVLARAYSQRDGLLAAAGRGAVIAVAAAR